MTKRKNRAECAREQERERAKEQLEQERKREKEQKSQRHLTDFFTKDTPKPNPGLVNLGCGTSTAVNERTLQCTVIGRGIKAVITPEKDESRKQKLKEESTKKEEKRILRETKQQNEVEWAGEKVEEPEQYDFDCDTSAATLTVVGRKSTLSSDVSIGTRTCSVCEMTFSTSALADKHIRTSSTASHQNYRKWHGIKFGLTPDEEDWKRSLNRRRMRIKREKDELYERLNDATIEYETKVVLVPEEKEESRNQKLVDANIGMVEKRILQEAKEKNEVTRSNERVEESQELDLVCGTIAPVDKQTPQCTVIGRKRHYETISYNKNYDFGGYNNYEEHKDIDFYRPDGSIERKSISWCKSNDFFQVDEDLWSGDWYYRKFPEKCPEKKTPCPVPGCRQEFRTISFADKHVRTFHTESHQKYRTEHGIKFGLTPDEKAEKEAADQQYEEKRIEREKNELYEILSDAMMDPQYMRGEAERARKRLRVIEEPLYKITCTASGCKSRFKTEFERTCHLSLYCTRDKAHQRAWDEFQDSRKKRLEIEERNHKIACTADGCKRRFKTESDLKCHLTRFKFEDKSHRIAWNEFEESRKKKLEVEEQNQKKLLVMKERNHKIACIVIGCKRRFETELDLKCHLTVSSRENKSHRREWNNFQTKNLELFDPSQKRLTGFFTKKVTS